MSYSMSRNAHLCNFGQSSRLRNNQVRAEQSVTSLNCLPARYGRKWSTDHNTPMHSLSVGPLLASVRENRWLANATALVTLSIVCMREAPTPSELASVWSSKGRSRSGKASTVGDANVPRNE